MEVAAATVEGEKYSLWCELGWKKSHPRENKRTEEKKKDDTEYENRRERRSSLSAEGEEENERDRGETRER